MVVRVTLGALEVDPRDSDRIVVRCDTCDEARTVDYGFGEAPSRPPREVPCPSCGSNLFEPSWSRTPLFGAFRNVSIA